MCVAAIVNVFLKSINPSAQRLCSSMLNHQKLQEHTFPIRTYLLWRPCQTLHERGALISLLGMAL